MPPPRRPFTMVLVAWTFFVWTARITNIWGDGSLTSGEKWGRTGLALSFTALAIAVGVDLFRRARWGGSAVKALAGWTMGVWATRSVGIAIGDHSAAFITVHLVLAAISVALASLALREQTRLGRGPELFRRRSIRLGRPG